MSRKISQIEARRLRKRVQELERIDYHQKNAWAQEWPGGVHLQSAAVSGELWTAVRTARKLNHAVVVTAAEASNLMFYALELPK